jgi:nitrogen-specific signal transduction histidine kinase/CheY-like chemotaxis protein
VFVVNDITAILQTERALLQFQKMEAVGQLTGGLAHDFNNLLAVMIGNLDLLQENASIDAETREIQQEALDAALRGAELTRQLLAFSRRQPLQPKRTNLNDLVTSTARLLKKVLGENITIRTRLADRPWTIMADPSQVETSLMNLAINARDAMAQGGTLLVETANVVLDEDYVRLNHEVVPGEYAMMAVSDSGSGMAPEIVARVFEPFFTTKPAGKGTGLGLSMVYGFVKQSGGHAKVYSEVGVGTTIRLYFPKARDDVADPGSAAEDEPAPPAAKGETVLVVEDKDDVRRVACRQLRKYGYNVIDAENGSVALDILRSGRPVDLLFTDVVMPGDWSGPALAEEARKLRPGLKLLFASGFPGMVLPPQMLAEGNGFISKPYRHQELNRMIRRILGDDDA